jgi:hypothetical protein
MVTDKEGSDMFSILDMTEGVFCLRTANREIISKIKASRTVILPFVLTLSDRSTRIKIITKARSIWS